MTGAEIQLRERLRRTARLAGYLRAMSSDRRTCSFSEELRGTLSVSVPSHPRSLTRVADFHGDSRPLLTAPIILGTTRGSSAWIVAVPWGTVLSSIHTVVPDSEVVA